MSEHVVTGEAANVESHAVGAVVWEVPSAIVAGERFRITVGVKCASECRLAQARVGVYDHAGVRVGTATLGDDLWSGTTGLYSADVELTAPADEGLFTWSVRAPDGDGYGPHDGGTAAFGVRVVRQPDHLVTVEAVDVEGQTPLAGARVVMHPFHAVTDAKGIARLRVARGSYRLFVSETGYVTFGATVDIATNLATRAELAPEPALENN